MTVPLEIPMRRFGFEVEQTLPGFMPPADPEIAALVPQEDPHHVFARREFVMFRAWWQSERAEPLYISGPPGCGKTAFVRQFAARAQVPVIELCGRANLEKADLVGSYVLKADGAMHWVDGPALRAWRHGLLLLVNEFTACEPSFWVANNEILEGAAIHVEATGERVPRHPLARLVITDNLKGGLADTTGTLQGRWRQDASVMDRMWKLQMDYLGADEEIRLLKRGLPQFGDDPATSERIRDAFARTLRRLAEQVRQAFLGVNDANEAIEVSLSTRTLLRLRDLILAFKDGARYGFDPLRDALDMALTQGCDDTSRQVIHKIAGLEFGAGLGLADPGPAP